MNKYKFYFFGFNAFIFNNNIKFFKYILLILINI